MLPDLLHTLRSYYQRYSKGLYSSLIVFSKTYEVINESGNEQEKQKIYEIYLKFVQAFVAEVSSVFNLAYEIINSDIPKASTKDLAINILSLFDTLYEEVVKEFKLDTTEGE